LPEYEAAMLGRGDLGRAPAEASDNPLAYPSPRDQLMLPAFGLSQLDAAVMVNILTRASTYSDLGRGMRLVSRSAGSFSANQFHVADVNWGGYGVVKLPEGVDETMLWGITTPMEHKMVRVPGGPDMCDSVWSFAEGAHSTFGPAHPLFKQ